MKELDQLIYERQRATSSVTRTVYGIDELKGHLVLVFTSAGCQEFRCECKDNKHGGAARCLKGLIDVLP